MREVILRLPEFLRPSMKRVGYVLGLNLEGGVIYNLQDPTGETYAKITSATEHEEMLYLGSIGENAIGRLPVP